MRHVEWIEPSNSRLGQPTPTAITLRLGDVYIFGVEMNQPCVEYPNLSAIKNALGDRGATHRWKDISIHVSPRGVDRNPPSWLRVVPGDRIFQSRPLLGNNRCLIWFKAKFAGPTKRENTQVLTGADGKITVAKLGNSKYTVEGDVTDILTKGGSYLLKSEWSGAARPGETCVERCMRESGGSRANCEAACGQAPREEGRPQDTEKVSGATPEPSATSPSWTQTPPPGTPTPPPGAPATPEMRPMLQLYVIDKTTNAAAPFGAPQPMTHERARDNIEAAVARDPSLLFGYGAGNVPGAGPNFGIYDTRLPKPAWTMPLVQVWYFDDAEKKWKRWWTPIPINPPVFQQTVENLVNSGQVTGGGWGLPRAGEPLAVYREGAWQKPGMYQLWIQKDGQWVKLMYPALRAETGVKADIEKATAKGSGPLGYSVAGAEEPTWVFQNGQWSQVAVSPQEPDLPTGVLPEFPNLGFPTPAMAGVPAAVASKAMDAINQAAAACPDIAVADGPLQHAAAAFAVFAAMATATGGNPDANLDALRTELDKLCPQWRTKAPGDTPVIDAPPAPTTRPEVSDLLSRIVLALASAALGALPDLYRQAKDMGLQDVAEQIRAYAEGAGAPIPDTEKPPPPEDVPDEEPPDMTEPPTGEKEPPVTEKKAKKKGISPLAVAAGVAAVAVVGVLAFG